jgi:hypothetical protein
VDAAKPAEFGRAPAGYFRARRSAPLCVFLSPALVVLGFAASFDRRQRDSEPLPLGFTQLAWFHARLRQGMRGRNIRVSAASRRFALELPAAIAIPPRAFESLILSARTWQGRLASCDIVDAASGRLTLIPRDVLAVTASDSTQIETSAWGNAPAGCPRGDLHGKWN